MSVSIDKIDHKILQHLLNDGRVSFSAIAKDVALTDVGVKKRVDRLKRKGIINSISADINLKVLGYENPLYVQIRSDLSKTKNLVKKLGELDYIIELHNVLGEYNLLAKLVVPSLDSADKFISRLGALDGVIDIKTMVVVSEVKKANSLPIYSLQKTLP